MKKSLGAQTLLFPCPVILVGTYDENEKPNIMAVSWGGICCSHPPCISVSLRKATYSYSGLVRNGAFTANIPSKAMVKEADHAGLYSGRDQNKFEACGLTAVKSSLVKAPYVEQCPLVLECRVLHTLEIGLHTMFVGEIVDTKVDPAIINESGVPDIRLAEPFVYALGTREYFGLGDMLGPAFAIGAK